MKRFIRPFILPIRPALNIYRRRQSIAQRQRSIREQAKRLIAQGNPLKIVIGAGTTQYEGWVSTDLPYHDILMDNDWAALFTAGTIDRILAEHVFEHLTIDQFQAFLRITRRYLTTTGRIRIAVPDGNHPDHVYIDYVRPNGTGIGADDHKVLYTYELMQNAVEQAGYNYQFLEWFDSDGQFHQVEWDSADGHIHRSAHYDKRNQGKPLSYTSLIVDVWPKVDD